jgi:protein-L-isoaspartate(D-aspartate) O-methyltransferase
MTEHNFEQMRRAMVANSLRTTGVNDPRVLAAMGAVPRERFVPRERIGIAYADTLVPLGNGRDLNSPLALGRMLTEAAPQEGERVLVIGAATGYAAAVMARLAGSVIATEDDPALVEWARKALADTDVNLSRRRSATVMSRGRPTISSSSMGRWRLCRTRLSSSLWMGAGLRPAILDRGVTRISIGRRAW